MIKLISSWDDGAVEDLRLASLLKKYRIPAIFYIHTWCDLSTNNIKWLNDSGFTLGGHTSTHPKDLKLLDVAKQRQEILSNKKHLENIIGKQVDTFAYPSGRYNDATVQILKKLKFKTARTTVVGETNLPADNFRIKTSVHVYPENKRFEKPNWLKEAHKLYTEAIFENGAFHLWGHSWELTKFDLWDELEEFLKFLSERRDEWKPHEL